MTAADTRDILPIMTQPPDSQDVAKRFLDLWQDQVSRMSTDPDLAEGMRRWQAFWMGMGQPGPESKQATPDGLQPGYGPGTRPSEAEPAAPMTSQDGAGTAYDEEGGAVDAGPEHSVDGRNAGGNGGRSSRLTASGAAPGEHASGSATAAAVSGDGGNDLAVVIRELRRLESRIAALERSLDSEPDDKRKPAKRRRSEDRGPEGTTGRAGGRPPKRGK